MKPMRHLGVLIVVAMVATFFLAEVAGADRANDKATARRALLELGDLPGEEWKDAPNTDDEDSGIPDSATCDGCGEPNASWAAATSPARTSR